MKLMSLLSEQHISTIKDASKKLTGSKRRAFQAQVSIDYLKSKPRLAERTFGWDRNTVNLGLQADIPHTYYPYPEYCISY